MANLIKVKRTNTASSVPSLVYGELGWNSADSKFFVGSFANTSVQVGGSGTVTSVSVVTANGVSGSVATSTTTPAITVTLGAITPSSVTVSGVITCSAGSAALPSITTSSDTNTGLFFPAADTVGLSTGGVERVRVDSSGNVGLGVRLAGGATNSYHLGTQAGLGLSIYHSAKDGQIDAYQPRRHLSAHTYNDTATNYGIMRIRIPAIAGGGQRFTIKHTGITTPAFSRSWEINCADYYSGNYTFGTNSLSVEGAPEFSRIRLMENTSETIWNSNATRYLILGQIIDGIGTVSNTAASATVTGSGTKFTHLLKVGDGILINSLWNYVTAIASDTSLTVSAAITLANTAVVYSRGDVFFGSQLTIDLDQLHAGQTLQINTAFEIDFADTEATLSLVAGTGRDITLNNTNAQHGFVGVGTQSPSNLLHVAQQKLGRGTVSNSASGTTVTGVNTVFLDTFKVGDSITIPHIGGSTGTPQTVVISAIASNTSMTVAAITNANAAGSSYSLAGGSSLIVTGGGNVTTGLGQLSVTGGQIVFPATANLSAGANTLDDYEEGTWTPTFTASTTNPTVTYDAAVRYGTYIKIGKTVFISGAVAITVLTAAGSGTLRISGLPFNASSATTGGYGVLAIGYKTGWTTTTPGTAYTQESAAFIQLGNEAMTANISTANLSATSYVQFSGFYNTTS